MVSGPRSDGSPQITSARVRKTIQSIKEIVGNHSDADIYVMLKESNMDPNETAQKLLNQDPFHEVRRKRDKKKENTSYKVSTESRKRVEDTRQGTKPRTLWDRNAWRGGYSQNPLRGSGVSKEFRIVRDNRVNQNINGITKPVLLKCSTSSNEEVASNVPAKSSPGILTDEKHSDARNSVQQLPFRGSNAAFHSATEHARHADSNGTRRQALAEETGATSPISTSRAQGQKPQNPPSRPTTSASSRSVVGVYSSSTDPVHVPSPDSRSSGAVGAIKREVGVVGVRRQSSEQPVTRSSVTSSSFSIPLLGKDISASTESFGQSPPSQSVMADMSVTRSFLGHQYHSKPHQQPTGHQKASQPNMEWKPKSSQKSGPTSPGVIGNAATPISSSVDQSTTSAAEETHLLEKLSQVNVSENQHVIIPQHLRVPEADRSRLTFGSFGAGFDSTKGFTSGLQTFVNVEESKDEPAVSISLSAPVTSSEEVSGGDEMDLLEDQVRPSRSESPASEASSENLQADTKESSSPRNLGNFANVGLVRSNTPSFSRSEPQQQQDPHVLPSFPAYASQTGYDVPFLRSSIDENVRGQGLSSPQEALISHVTNSGTPSSVPMVQQQPVTQLYPQVHIPHFPNFVPYRQFLSPLYGPPVAMPNYSGNPAYPHPPNGSSYLLMPGGSSHLTTGGLKYAASQYKPVPAGGATGYGSYTNPAGYAISGPGTVGGPAGLEDSSRMKYKEGNLYVPNPQAETSEIWFQSPRELPNLQSSPYYNLSGQAPHAAYMPSHTGHASFNGPAQSTHVPFPGLYHPPQPATISNPHHLVHQPLPGMGGNVGVAAPGGQVGSYQQPQLGHLNWTANF
ncbi:GBF-interacting protein 1-like [Magnolia sinica]|uniref:GBF-interacting protein 1-like n=1 Tax=Magnolia sinica TaxID=86752 RepID=UPI00265A5B8E|nr:GBF-interacting protein 1-like [Magnolia sinica]